MKLDNLNTIEQMQAFLTGSQPIAFVVATSKDARYQFVEGVLKRFAYARLKRHDTPKCPKSFYSTASKTACK
jgi:hypothetical protein